MQRNLWLSRLDTRYRMTVPSIARFFLGFPSRAAWNEQEICESRSRGRCRTNGNYYSTEVDFWRRWRARLSAGRWATCSIGINNYPAWVTAYGKFLSTRPRGATLHFAHNTFGCWPATKRPHTIGVDAGWKDLLLEPFRHTREKGTGFFARQQISPQPASDVLLACC